MSRINLQSSSRWTVLGVALVIGSLAGCKAKQSQSSAKEFQAKVGTGLGPLNLIGLDPADGKVKIRSCTTDQQKEAVLNASGDIVDGILPVDFTKCTNKGIDELGQGFQEVSLEVYKNRLATHLGARDFSQDELIIASSYLDLEALIRAYGRKELVDSLGQINRDRSDIDGLILQPGAVLDDVEDDGDYLRRAEDSYKDQISKLELFKQYRVRPQDQATYDKVIERLQALLTSQKNNWSETQKYKYIMMHIEGKFGERGNAKLISSQGNVYKSAVFPLKDAPTLFEARNVLSAHRYCRSVGGTVATYEHLKDTGILANVSDDILLGSPVSWRSSAANVFLYQGSLKKPEFRMVGFTDIGNDTVKFRFACTSNRTTSVTVREAKMCFVAFAFELNRGDAYFKVLDDWEAAVGKPANSKPSAEAVKASNIQREGYRKQHYEPARIKLRECQAEYEAFASKATPDEYDRIPSDYKQLATIIPEIVMKP